MQIHIAMNEPPRWGGDERLARTPIVHLTPGLDGVSRAVNEADRGLLPAEATIALGSRWTVDPVPRARGLVGDLGAAPGAAAAPEGRTRPASSSRRRLVDGGAAARRTPTGSSSGSAATSRTSSPRPSDES
jgi:phytoene dehydrogenase-like protein